MPIYEYKCLRCRHTKEFIVRHADGDKRTVKCEKCGGEAVKVITRTSFRLVGNGFYKNDYGGR